MGNRKVLQGNEILIAQKGSTDYQKWRLSIILGKHLIDMETAVCRSNMFLFLADYFAVQSC